MRDPLSPREREVALLVSEGLTNKEIARRLFISERTAEGHVEQIRRKLGFNSRSQVAAWVVERGVRPEAPPRTRGIAARPTRRTLALLAAAVITTVLAVLVIGMVLGLGRGRETARDRLETIAGLGTLGFSGDGGPATKAQLDEPTSLAVDPREVLYFADSSRQLNPRGVFEGYTRIRFIGTDGVIRTYAGNGTDRPADGGFGPTTRFLAAVTLAIDPAGRLFVALQNDPVWQNAVARFTPDGHLGFVAGTDRGGYSGDGGPAVRAQLFKPRGIAIDHIGNVYIADSGNNVVRRVGTDGIIQTVAGNGERAYSGDGGPPTSARFFAPAAVAVGPDGSLYISDTQNHRVRRIDPTGRLATWAGSGTPGSAGDGRPADQAELNTPQGLAVAPDGALYIADLGNNRVRRVGPDGRITTVAGDGRPQVLLRPEAVALGKLGKLYIADSGNHRIRTVQLARR